MANKRKRQRKRLRRVPAALRRVYGDLVQTLEAAILSLLPPPPSSPTECRCRGRLCLGCGTPAYLLRQDDPPDYRILLTRGLCVLSCDAPPPPRVFHGDDAPQRVLVRNARELILDNMLETMNVLCNGHDKESHFNIAGEFLCTSTWDLLLHRIGFQLMVFLLRFSSIFIPVRNKSYYQVTGHPMDKIFEGSKFLKTTSTSSNQQPFFPEAMQNMGCSRSLKRKQRDMSGRSNMGAAAVSVCSKSKDLGDKRDNGSKVSCGKFERVGGRTEVVQFDGGEPNIKILWDHDSSQNTLSKCGGPILHDSVFQSYFDKLHLEKLKSPCTKCHNNEKESICTDMPGLCLSRKYRKHRRLYSWQRRRKYKGPEENIPGKNNKIRLQMKFLDSDCSLCHWPSEPSVPASTEEDIMKDFELTASKDTEASREKCSHLMLSQDMCQGQITFSTKKTHHRPRSETNDASEGQHHASLKNLSIQPLDFAVSSLYNNRFTPNELFPEESDCSASKNQLNLHSHFEKVGSMCFYCLIMQSSQKVEIRDQIDRSFIFYNRSSAYTVFPKNHILNLLKPNDCSAIRLMKHIFGFPDRSKNFMTCTDCSIGCAIESQCLYHFLLGLLKSLIRNAQRCQCKKLLFKHCIQTSKLHSMDENRSKSEGISLRIQKEKLLYVLREHLKCNILQVGQNFYLQKVGIPQGSVLSSLLCSYYYGHMERSLILPYLQRSSSDLVVSSSKYTINECTTELANNAISGVESLKYDMACLGCPNITDLGKNNLLPFTEHHATEVNTVTSDKECSTSGENLLLRLIDDFIFISTSKEQAGRFFNRMTRGFRAYNCYSNKTKFGTNFGMTQNHGLINRIYSGADGILFLPWSGLLINCQTLEIQADYTRYFGINIRSTLTIELHAKPCYRLKEKLLNFVKTRCHPIFYDSNINAPATVCLNAYQAFLLCAMKFHCYIHSMQDVTKPKPSYLLEIIERSFRYMYKHIMKLMHDMLHHFGIHPSLGLAKREVLWLGLSAYICVLRKKQSRYKELLSLLRSRIATYGRIEDASSHLRYAVDESHSSFFSKIKF
nr:PREDICTED: telomerase reverse transcriptase isoform X6 [Musa acuminata subsp. malaccensis]